jgi:ABC-type uncharacterized transport system substrate-binding protein
MRRRDFIRLIGGAALASPLAARAQPSGTTRKIGVLWQATNAEEAGSNLKALVKGFADLGYDEGRQIALENRFANDPERLKSMATELVAGNVEVLLAVGNNAALHAKAATPTIPVVFVLVADPVGSKLVENLQRPGGNVTGLSSGGADLVGKRVALIKEIIPGFARLAVLVNANEEAARAYAEAIQVAAPALGITAQSFEWHTVNDIGPAFDGMKKANAQAFTTISEGAAYASRALIGQIALARNLPLVGASREMAKAGALVSLAVDADAICHDAAAYADKIFKGESPGELPVEEPTKFELLVNRKTAKALGLTIPQPVLQRANQVID